MKDGTTKKAIMMMAMWNTAVLLVTGFTGFRFLLFSSSLLKWLGWLTPFATKEDFLNAPARY